jgi:hypothetical protein
MPTTILPRFEKPATRRRIITTTTDRTLKATEDTAIVIVDSTTARTVTLPRPQKGLTFRVFIKTPAAATGHTVAPHDLTGSGPKTFGKVSPTGAAFAAAAGKSHRNTQATSIAGDSLFLYSDGTDWFADPAGTWAEV